MHIMERLFFLSIFISFSSALQYQTLLGLRDNHLSTSGNSLTLKLIHIDHLKNPNPNMTRQSTFENSLRRDLHRVPSLSASAPTTGAANSSVFSGVPQGTGEYFTRFGVGTPPTYVNMVLDTGSDVTWLQCAPCAECYEQTDPIFNPTKSSTYRKLSCTSKRCMRLENPGCQDNTCQYQVTYGDGSFTSGDFATETLTLRRNRVERIPIGCGHDNEGLFVGGAGLLGLGKGKLSFPNQMGRGFTKKFSYCLVSRLSPDESWIMFGEESVSREAVFTPMLSNPVNPSYYYLNLTGISVGGALVPGITPAISKFHGDGSGGVMIDSGTVVTWMEESAYVALRKAFREGAKELTKAAKFLILDTCYDFSGTENVTAPAVELHFDGGAGMQLPVENYLVEVDDNRRFCLAFAPSAGATIIGNIQQQGYRVVYDLKDKRVGFAPNSC